MGSYRCVEHGDIIDENVLDNVDLPLVLPQRADGDAVGAVAVQILHEDFRAVGFEGDAVWQTFSA